MSPYQTTTMLRATQDVAARLGDVGMVRWSQTELVGFVTEALRTFNALTGYYRDHGVFNTESEEAFYDLSAVVPELLGYTVTDADLVSVIQAHLLEPVNAVLWEGSDQFTLDDLTAALQRRRDQFLLETGLVVAHHAYPISPPPDGRIPLDEAIATVRRVAWETTDGVVTPLHRDDIWNINAFSPGWLQLPARPGQMPIVYSVGETPPLVLQVAPPPQDTGVLDLVVVPRGTRLDPTVGVLLGVPDDWTWVVKFGALADLLSKDGLAFDPLRAQYCQERWEQGIAAAKATSTVWAARINNVVVPLDAVTAADDFLSGWQTGIGQPSRVLLAGGNLVALTPVPDLPGLDANYAVSVDVVRNAPLPNALTEYLQVGPELLDPLYDYCVHLALFKEGPDGVTASKPLLDRFLRFCGIEVALDQAQTPNRDALRELTARDEAQTPRMVS